MREVKRHLSAEECRNKRSHWINDDLESEPQTWFEAAEEKPGSWWPDWDSWTISTPEGHRAPKGNGVS
jgi:poly(3-hydroxyalkanoate) synthetase